MTKRLRLDQWLLDKGHFETREKARQEILAGRIYDKKDGRVLDKPGIAVKASDFEVRVAERPRYVSRAGEKLESFFSQLEEKHPKSYQSLLKKISTSWTLDVGASTGGFSDYLLQKNALGVIAVDVGTNQLHEKIRRDPRVKSFEKSDIREFDVQKYQSQIQIVVVDVSFISVLKFLDSLLEKLPHTEFILLFKPQFEAGRWAKRIRGVLEENERIESVKSFRDQLTQLKCKTYFEAESSVKGAEGNQETFFYFKRINDLEQ